MVESLVKVNNTPITLIHFDRAREELALASSIDEVKQIRDQAEAIRQYIKQQKGSFEMQNQAAEIKLRAERKAGQMLKDMDIKPGNPQLSHDVIIAPKLNELDITPMQSHRWQLEAEIPEDKFEQFIKETKESAEELTSKAALRIASKMRHTEELNNPNLPNDVFNVIYADPPWQYDNTGVIASAETHYKTMSIEELCAMDFKVSDNAALFLWVTNPFLQDAFDVVEAWGFEYKTNIVWIKRELVKPGVGFYVRGRHELLYICTRGSFVPDMEGKEPLSSIIESPVREHSQKPEDVYQVIETMYPNGKYLELFARQKRDGWECWGNEIGS